MTDSSSPLIFLPEALYKDFLAHAEGMTLHGGRFSELVRIPPPSTLPTIAASLLVDAFNVSLAAMTD
jgi:hypothetical protein